MTFSKVNLAYFSATGTTAKIVSAIENGLAATEKITINLTNPDQGELSIRGDEIIIFGIPVFSGRVPEIARRGIEKIKGDHTPAIIACVYGNREFDDALLELKDIVESNGFYVISAAAFVSQHSIFPKVATGRPDSSDLAKAKEFGVNSLKIISALLENTPLKVKGNRPYRPVKSIPLTPKADGKCNACGLCSRQCPVQAINTDNPKKTDKSKCISCAHCIYVCPQQARKFRGLLYRIASRKFIKNYSQRKEPYLVYRQ